MLTFHCARQDIVSMQSNRFISRLVSHFERRFLVESSGRSLTTRHRNKQWEQMLSELLDYRTKHGDTLVPTEYPDNPQLATWVDTQRQQYRFYQDNQQVIHMKQLNMAEASGDVIRTDRSDVLPANDLNRCDPSTVIKKSNLTEERIKILEEFGFVWDVHAYQWDERFKELLEYKNLHNSVVVPRVPQYETLYNWVFTQRRQYKLRQLPTYRSSLSQERIDKLEVSLLGFSQF
jgi:hypothetical protein